MMLPPFILVKTTTLLSGESWASLWHRLPEINHYEPPTILSAYVRERLAITGIRDNLERPIQAASYELLAQLTELSSLELYGATLHRFAPILTPPGGEKEQLWLSDSQQMSVLTKGQIAKHLYAKTTQYCPACLREAAYHRLNWQLLAVTVCLEHNCLLVRHCPGCRKPITVREVVRLQCQRCGYDLRRSPLIKIDDELGLFTQQSIQSWLTLSPPPDSLLFEPLPDASPQALYHFVYQLQNIIRGCRIGSYFHRVSGGRHCAKLPRTSVKTNVSPAETCALFSTAFKAITNWPEGFHGFIDAYRLSRRKDWDRGGWQEDLGALYGWLQKGWKPSAYQFVQDAFDAYFATHYDQYFWARRSARYRNKPALVEAFNFLTDVEAGHLLQVPTQSLTMLARNGYLKRYPSFDSSRMLFQREEIQALDTAWCDSLSVEEIAQLLDISRQMVMALINKNILVAEYDQAGKGEVVNERYIELFQMRLSSLVRQWSSLPHDVIDLSMAAQILEVVGMDEADVLAHVIYGALAAYHPISDEVKVADLRFSRLEVLDYIEIVKKQNRWMDMEDVIIHLRATANDVTQWMARGFLSPVARFSDVVYFDTCTVKAFEFAHVFEKVAVQMLKVDWPGLEVLIRTGQLHPISGPQIDKCPRYLFRRKDIETTRKVIRQEKRKKLLEAFDWQSADE